MRAEMRDEVPFNLTSLQVFSRSEYLIAAISSIAQRLVLAGTVIKQADWMTLVKDLEGVEGIPEGGFDAVVCLGNSIGHLPEPNCDLSNIRKAVTNLMSFVQPGGTLIMDHRNFDQIISTGTGSVPKSINHPVSMNRLKGNCGLYKL